MSSPVKTYQGDCYAKMRLHRFREKGPSYTTRPRDLSQDAQVTVAANTNEEAVKAALLAICKTNAENYSGAGIVKKVFLKSVSEITGQ